MSSGNCTVNGAVENDCDIPEWKKILLLKKKAGNVPCLLDDITHRNTDSCAVLTQNLKCNNANSRAKGTDQDFRDISAPKNVTIGNINVQLRSVKPSSLDNHCKQKTESNLSIENKFSKFDNDCKDLQYGPGIVDRLRAKFLNLGVKQSSKPVVRRFSSLENLPGSNGGLYRVNASRCSKQNVFKYGAGSPGSGVVKKALSMETLICSPEQPLFISCRRSGGRTAGSSVKGKILKTVCPTLADENEEPMEMRKWDANRVVPAPNINEDELPKPDTVKHVKKMFEPPPPTSLSNHCRFRKSSSTISTPTSNGAISGSPRPPVKTVDSADAKASANEDLSMPLGTSSSEKGDCEIDTQGSVGRRLSATRSCDTSLSSDPCLSSSLVRVVSASERESDEQTVVTDLSPRVTLAALSTPAARKPEPLLHEGSQGSEVEDEERPSAPGGRVDPEGMVVSADSAKTPWQKAPPATTSIVFDFRGKDVKPNISLNPAPFGCRPANVPPEKRLWAPFGMNGVDNESVFCNAEEEDWNEMDIGADLPLISGIVFSGENVIVGRGALLENRNKKLSIQFDDLATSTFEYPAEDESPLSEDAENSNECSLNFTKALNSGSNLRSGLSSYTPQVLSSGDFKLGILQCNHKLTLTEDPIAKDFSASDVIPASPDDTGGWSSTETVDILF